MSSKRRKLWSRWAKFHGNRIQRRRSVAGEISARTANQNLSAASGTEGLHSQSGWKDTAVRNTDYQRSGDTDGSGHRVRGDLWSGSDRRTVRVSTETKCTRRSQEGARGSKSRTDRS